MSMARLWCDQGKRDQVRELLAPVYGWFTEGSDTPDLKQAKTLIDELASGCTCRLVADFVAEVGYGRWAVGSIWAVFNASHSVPRSTI